MELLGFKFFVVFTCFLYLLVSWRCSACMFVTCHLPTGLMFDSLQAVLTFFDTFKLILPSSIYILVPHSKENVSLGWEFRRSQFL